MKQVKMGQPTAAGRDDALPLERAWHCIHNGYRSPFADNKDYVNPHTVQGSAPEDRTNLWIHPDDIRTWNSVVAGKPIRTHAHFVGTPEYLKENNLVPDADGYLMWPAHTNSSVDLLANALIDEKVCPLCGGMAVEYVPGECANCGRSMGEGALGGLCFWCRVELFS